MRDCKIIDGEQDGIGCVIHGGDTDQAEICKAALDALHRENQALRKLADLGSKLNGISGHCCPNCIGCDGEPDYQTRGVRHEAGCQWVAFSAALKAHASADYSAERK